MPAVRWLLKIGVYFFLRAVILNQLDCLGVTALVAGIISGLLTWHYIMPLLSIVSFALVVFGFLFFFFLRKSKREPYRTIYELAQKWEDLRHEATIDIHAALSGEYWARQTGGSLTDETLAVLHSYCNQEAIFKFERVAKDRGIQQKFEVMKEIAIRIDKYIRPEFAK